MSYELALDIGDASVELSGGSFVSNGAQVFSAAFDLVDPTVEFSDGSFVDSGAQVFSDAFDLGEETVEFGEVLAKSSHYAPQTFAGSAVVRIFALPVEDGDTGQLLVFNLVAPVDVGMGVGIEFASETVGLAAGMGSACEFSCDASGVAGIGTVLEFSQGEQ